ncbi:hypothetical protein A0H81_04732 [Grifola frondosa]|uniref:Integrase core domain-containing protein n=1 Tax=Grifola frondosa TaxID=5627 RepID=A0A1C7MGC7_GRIFR|nr:hypothetical protein A0H81_04732 [Grifola frondosa]
MLLTEFPPLPPAPLAVGWSANICQAYKTLSDGYSTAERVLALDDSDPLRLQFHCERINSEFIPILVAMEENADDSEESTILATWLEAAATAIGLLLSYLKAAADAGRGREHANVTQLHSTHVVHSGKKGRPRIIISEEFLAELMSPKRNVTGLRASTNNRASTVLDVFLHAVEEYGAPSRVRGDRGGENVDVSVWMILRRGPNRASFMWGSSTHNTRIEHLWVEADWNAHPLSGTQANDTSPQDLRILGQTMNGIYVDDGADVHPDVLHQHYGVTLSGPIVRRLDQTGAGHPLEENDSDNEDTEHNVATEIEAGQQHHIRHDPIDVPSHKIPFADSGLEALFFAALEVIRVDGVLPEGYGLLAGEQDESYNPHEFICSGR